MSGEGKQSPGSSTPRLPGSSSLLIATHNRAKAAEIAAILRDAGLDPEIVSLADFPEVVLPEETGSTFVENALAKAKAAAAATGLPAIADDSGIEVDALGGEPGVLSARYGGPDATDRERYQKVLRLLKEVPDAERTARFRCAAAYATPDGQTLLAEGTVEGRIAREPVGSGGFGYDPIFIPDGEARTMAQLSPSEKDAISHRGRAFRALARLIGGPSAQSA
ncbi:MAG: RdgB/HAM1 family non-canonical purine NTP pyrophosphatase [Armatimonadota bacterium]